MRKRTTMILFAILWSTAACSSTAQDQPGAALSFTAPQTSAPASVKMVSVPEGTSLEIVLTDSLNSAMNTAGDTFRASLVAPLVIEGALVLEKGARVRGRVVEAKESERSSEFSILSLELTAVVQDWKFTPIVTRSWQERAEYSRTRDASVIAGPETRLTFILSRSVTLQVAGSGANTPAAVDPEVEKAANHPPIVFAHGPARILGGEPARFDSRGTRDPDGDPLTLTWAFDDGTKESGAESTHIFTTPGDRVVHLIVSDGQGNQTSTSVRIFIVHTEGNAPPVPAIGGPYSGYAGVPLTFDASESKEPDGDEMTFTWDFGDGTKESGPRPPHTFKMAGTYTVKLIVSDDNGNAVLVSTRVVIQP